MFYNGVMLEKNLIKEIKAYLKEYYEGPSDAVFSYKRPLLKTAHKMLGIMPLMEDSIECAEGAMPVFASVEQSKSLEEILKEVDESFSDSIFRIIREKNLDETEVYKKAGIDRRLFSKIRSDSEYRPGKSTVLVLAVALELSIEETEALLEKAGFALSYSNKADLIVRFFIESERYDLSLIDEALLKFDQKTLLKY